MKIEIYHKDYLGLNVVTDYYKIKNNYYSGGTFWLRRNIKHISNNSSTNIFDF